jgi:hypothetical protein
VPPAVSTPEAQAWIAEAMEGHRYIVADLQTALDAATRSTEESFS